MRKDGLTGYQALKRELKEYKDLYNNLFAVYKTTLIDKLSAYEYYIREFAYKRLDNNEK